MSRVEEKFRKALGEEAFRVLRWHISRAIGMDMIEALEKDPEKVEKASEELFKNRYAVELLIKIVGLPPNPEKGGRG